MQAASTSIPEHDVDALSAGVGTLDKGSPPCSPGADCASAKTVPIRAYKTGSLPVPMSPSCMQPQEMAAQVLFAEEEIGRLQVELQAAHKHEATMQAQLRAAREELVRSQ